MYLYFNILKIKIKKKTAINFGFANDDQQMLLQNISRR